MANKSTRSLSSRKGLDKNLFEEISQQSKHQDSKEKLKAIGKEFDVGSAVTLGTSSFYDFTRLANVKNEIKICNGTACLCAGTQDKLKAHLEKHFSSEQIGHASCVGRCHTNGALMYKGNTYAIPDTVALEKLINDTDNVDTTNHYHVDSNTTPILTSKIDDITIFFSLSDVFKDKNKEVIQSIKKANLRGRGGAGFPFWFKLDAVIKEENKQKYIVCNGDEGDPGAFSDMYLMEVQPFKVLFGMYISGLTVGADTGVLYVRGEYPDSVRIIKKSIQFLTDSNLTPGFKWKVIEGQGSYVCGEETALLSSIEGLRPEVRVRPPYPAQYGLYGKPTVLSNVETFANIHWILANGGEAFAHIGSQQSTGTKLVSLDSFFNQPGMYEIEMGTPVEDIIDNYGKGFKSDIKAIQIGGPLGGIVPIEKLQNLTLDFESFTNNGFLLGHASFVSIPLDFPMIKYIEHLLKFTADESCGKCYPCRIGSFRGFEMIQKAQLDNYKIDSELFYDLLETLEIGSLCALGGGLPLPIRNALAYFDGELGAYFKGNKTKKD